MQYEDLPKLSNQFVSDQAGSCIISLLVSLEVVVQSDCIVYEHPKLYDMVAWVNYLLMKKYREGGYE